MPPIPRSVRLGRARGAVTAAAPRPASSSPTSGVSIPVSMLSFARGNTIQGVGSSLDARHIGALMGITTAASASAAAAATSPATETDPAVRFTRLNAHFRQRHCGKDHIVQAQHGDVRIAAIRNTVTVREAVRRHALIAEEASLWAPLAAGASLYASSLRGDERVKVELALADDAEGAGEDANIAYVEGFAVGEVRGYAVFEQLRQSKALAGARRLISGGADSVVAAGGAGTGNGDQHRVGEGVMQVSKVLYGMEKPYVSKIAATGDAETDWQHFLTQSEQVTSFIHFQYDVDGKHRAAVKPSGATSTSPESVTGDSSSAPEAETVPVVAAASPAAGGNALLTPSTEDSVRFSGGVLVQVLAGPPSKAMAAKILSERPRPSGEDAVEETEEQYVKRMQMEHLRSRVASLDMNEIMSRTGVAGYVASVLGMDPADLGNAPEGSPNQQANVDKEFDFEALERRAFNTSYAEKARAAEGGDAYGPSLGWQYRPLAFFCRCSQAKPEQKLRQLPVPVLDDLIKDGGATFTCDFCADEVVVSLEQIQDAHKDLTSRK